MMMARALSAAALLLTTAAAPDAGERVFQRHCAACHAAGMPGTIAIKTRSPAGASGRIDLTGNLPPQVTTAVVRSGIGSMPRFRKTEIGDEDLRMLATWLGRKTRR